MTIGTIDEPVIDVELHSLSLLGGAIVRAADRLKAHSEATQTARGFYAKKRLRNGMDDRTAG